MVGVRNQLTHVATTPLIAVLLLPPRWFRPVFDAATANLFLTIGGGLKLFSATMTLPYEGSASMKVSRNLPAVWFCLLAIASIANYAMADTPPAAQDNPPPAATSLVVVPGKTTQFEIVLPENLRRFAGRGKLSAVTTALATVAVPANFDPARAWPMLVISASSDPGYTDSRAWMRGFVAPALAAGWVVFAADAAEVPGVPAADNNELRLALVLAAQSALAKVWPDSVHWPLAFGGFSGGAKRSGVLAFLSTVEGRTPIGIFLGGCNEPTPVMVLDAYREPLPQFLKIPVFLSSGSRDPVATPEQHEEVARQLAAAGFSALRLETYPGRHNLYQEHVQAALQWFAALHAASPVTSPLTPRPG
jgi:surfactin synthase thioesterase subunit